MIRPRDVSVLGLLVIATIGACQSEPVPVVHVNLGNAPSLRRSFQPKSSLAEYVELPGLGAELRVLLSSHEMTCDGPSHLLDDQVLVSLTFTVPNGQKLGKMAFVWPLPTEKNSGDEPRAAPTTATVMPFVRFGKVGHEIPPGGQVEITDVVLDPQGTVHGVLRLEQPGAQGVSASSILGSFSARWCRVSLGTSTDSN